MDDRSSQLAPQLEKAHIEIAAERRILAKLFSRLPTKVDAGDRARFVNQYRYWLKRLEDNLERADLRPIDVDKHPYDPGVAAIPGH